MEHYAAVLLHVFFCSGDSLPITDLFNAPNCKNEFVVVVNDMDECDAVMRTISAGYFAMHKDAPLTPTGKCIKGTVSFHMERDT